jgi:hypothetical protein
MDRRKSNSKLAMCTLTHTCKLLVKLLGEFCLTKDVALVTAVFQSRSRRRLILVKRVRIAELNFLETVP